MSLRLAPLLFFALLTACSRESAEGAPAPGLPDAEANAPDFQGRSYERNIIFLTPREDSVLLVPWLTSARTVPGSVRRSARGFLARGGTGERFSAEEWETEPTRTPWRLLPRKGMRFVVGEHDAIEQIFYEEGPRQLQVGLGEPIVEWSGPRGETFRILEGTLVLASTRVAGLVLDMTRALRAQDRFSGEWGVVVSGDSLQVALHAPQGVKDGPTPPVRIWARRDEEEIQWPEVTVTWSERRAFERARRDVPVVWGATSLDGQLDVRLTVKAAEIQAGAGEGPQLPVDALFEVEGTVRIDEAEYPVRGFLRHIQS